MLSIFWQKFENTKWPPFFERGNFFENWQKYIAEIPCGSKISTISLSRTVKEIEANLCFAILGKNSKIQNGRHFGGGKIFENCQEYIAQIPCGSKISTKSLYLARLKR